MKNLFGSRLLNIGASTLLSGGILSHGGLGGYISEFYSKMRRNS